MLVFDRLSADWRRYRLKPSGPFASLKIALIADELTRTCLRHRCQVRDVTPANYRAVFETWKPDLFFVESAWEGHSGSWKYGIASYADFPERTNGALAAAVACAGDRGIPALFWNKEDSAHFDRFIASARLFPQIFTVDSNCIARYGALTPPGTRVEALMFAVEPAIHSPGARDYIYPSACFAGSYSRHVHERRRGWQDMMFGACRDLGLTVYDRNSTRRSGNYRYPDMPWIAVRPRVAHDRTAQIYRDHMVALNVNTVEDSPTMFSRRLIESLACAAFTVTNPALSVDRLFAPYCVTVHGEAEMQELCARLKGGLSASDRERARAGAAHVLAEHTWAHRIAQILNAGGSTPGLPPATQGPIEAP